MEIHARPNVAPVSQQPAQINSAPTEAARQELPKPGSIMPSIEAKAAPKIPEHKAQDLARAVEELQEFVECLGRNLNFRVDDSINRSIITVRDAQTDTVIRQIPSEEIISIARQISESLREIRAGLLMDSQA